MIFPSSLVKKIYVEIKRTGEIPIATSTFGRGYVQVAVTGTTPLSRAFNVEFRHLDFTEAQLLRQYYYDERLSLRDPFWSLELPDGVLGQGLKSFVPSNYGDTQANALRANITLTLTHYPALG